MIITSSSGTGTGSTFGTPPTADQAARAKEARVAELVAQRHEIPALIFRLYCRNGHPIGDEQSVIGDGFKDYRSCARCHVGKPWLYRWEL